MPQTTPGLDAPFPADLQPTHARRWVVVFAITLAIIQYIDRVCISQAAPFIAADLRLTPEQMGYVFSAFMLAYALFEIPGGYIGDRFGPRRVLLRIVVWWSFFTAVTGWAWNAVSLVVTRFLFGAGEAGCFPNLTKAFDRWLPSAERGRAQGVMWMFARWGGAVAPMLVYACLQFMPWRMTFVAFALLGLVWAVLFSRWFQDDPRRHPSVNAAEAALMPPAPVRATSHFAVPWGKFLRSRTVWGLCLQYAMVTYAWNFFITWFPTYLLKARGLDLKQSALLAGTPLLLGGCGAFVSGWLTPLVARALGGLGRARCAVGFGALTAAAGLLALSVSLRNPYAAVTAIALVSFCNDLTVPNGWTACMDVGGAYCGTLSGTMNMVGNLGGVLSPIMIGIIVGRTNDWTTVFYVTSAVYFVGAVLWLVIDPVTPLEQQVKD